MTQKRQIYVVRWQDGTYDPYHDQYKEIVTKKSYWNWAEGNMAMNKEGLSLEDPQANSDVLSDEFSVWQGGEAYPPEGLQRLERALMELTEKQRYVFEQVYKNQRSQQELAEELGVSKAAVNELVTKAMKKVQAHFNVEK